LPTRKLKEKFLSSQGGRESEGLYSYNICFLYFATDLPFLGLGVDFSFIIYIYMLKIRIYRTIILPFLLYGCETWSLTLKEERRLREFENRVLRRIFGGL
jgi:hypothetical protein